MTPLPAYVWQPSTDEIAARAGIDPADVVRADQNTSPFTPPWAGEVAAAAAATANEYPSGRYLELRRAVASYLGADERMVVPGAGADELILLAARAFLTPGSAAVADSPTYAMYRIASLQQGAEYREVSRERPALAFPTEALAEAATAASVTWLCAPHNPVGDRPASADVAAVAAAAGGITVVDAAYAEFSPEGWDGPPLGEPDVVVLGTLSKAFALAGARVGYAVASPEHAEALDRIRPPGSVSAISTALALRSLAEVAWMREHVARITELREELSAGLGDLGLEPRPSHTNFVLVEVGPGAGDLADSLLARGVALRRFPAGHPLDDHLRVTVRRRDQQERMLDALEQEMR